jgi:hypothetical protein
MGFQYNGKLRAPELLLRAAAGRPVDLIRRREDYDYLFGNTLLPRDLAANVPAAYRYGERSQWLTSAALAAAAAGALAALGAAAVVRHLVSKQK